MILGRASGNEDKMTPHARAKLVCFCDKKRSPLKSFTAVAGENAVSIAEHLVRILREGDDESKDVAADVFCDLSDYKHSIPVVRSSVAIPILVNLLSEGNVEVRERVSRAIAKLSHDKTDRVALADAGAVPLMIDLLHDE
ncbi:hypothetical protein Dsin_023331 [Dipteronia sinensis]|uniref:Uncharacterized protein n=1 Tax=Dipteronia sinensis TaxID=43782 RepID=A0AAE0E0S2_9ROSI|nr:hypothetical protein Dsin_023331 [Dipteronia sinensis]